MARVRSQTMISYILSIIVFSREGKGRMEGQTEGQTEGRTEGGQSIQSLRALGYLAVHESNE